MLSVKDETYQVIHEHRPHLILFQETRKVMENTSGYNWVNCCRETPSSGGGVAIGLDHILTYRNLTEQSVPEALRDQLELLFVQVVHE